LPDIEAIDMTVVTRTPNLHRIKKIVTNFNPLLLSAAVILQSAATVG
jgi:hypothetical protein